MSTQERYTIDDYQNGMPPRAFGSETEFTDSGSIGERYANYSESDSPHKQPATFTRRIIYD